MNPRLIHCGALGLFLTLAMGVAAHTPPTGEYQPRIGQAGKDVIWVPTPQELVDKMLSMAKAAPGDFVLDLGLGRWPNRHHRGQARHPRPWYRVQSGHGGVVEAQCRQGRGE